MSLSVTGPRANIHAIEKINEAELKYHLDGKSSWHDSYKSSSYIFIGGLDFRMNEGDVVIAFSQWGEPVDIHLMRDKKTGASKGFCFLAYEDQRSTILAVDNANGMKLLGRIIRVDHCKNFIPPDHIDEEGNKIDASDYKPTGAEGKGIGVYFVTRKENEKEIQRQQKEKHQKKSQLLKMNANAESGRKDVDEMWAEEFEMMLKKTDEEADREFERSKYVEKLRKKEKKERKRRKMKKKSEKCRSNISESNSSSEGERKKKEKEKDEAKENLRTFGKG